MAEPALNMDDEQEGQTELSTANDNALKPSGRTVKVNPSGKTNLGEMKPGEAINLEFDVLMEENMSVPGQDMIDTGLRNDAQELLDKSYEPPKVANDNTTESNDNDPLKSAIESGQVANVANNLAQEAATPPELPPENDQNDQPDQDRFSRGQQQAEQERANQTYETETDEDKTPPELPTDNESQSSQDRFSRGQQMGEQGRARQKAGPARQIESSPDQEIDSGKSDERVEENPEEEQDNNERDEKTDEENDKNNLEQNEEEATTEDLDKEPPTIKSEEEKAGTENPGAMPMEDGSQPPKTTQPNQLPSETDQEPPQIDADQQPEADQNLQQQKNRDRAGNKMDMEENNAENNNPQDSNPEEKTGLKDKIKNSLRSDMSRLKKRKKGIVEELNKINDDLGKIANSDAISLISIFMPDVSAKITSSINSITSVKDALSEKKLKAQLSALNTLLAALEGVKSVSTIIDFSYFWSTYILAPLTFIPILGWILAIILIPPLLIIFYLLLMPLSSYFPKILAVITSPTTTSINEVIEKIKEAIKKLKEASKKIVLRKQLKDVDKKIINLNQQIKANK